MKRTLAPALLIWPAAALTAAAQTPGLAPSPNSPATPVAFSNIIRPNAQANIHNAAAFGFQASVQF